MTTSVLDRVQDTVAGSALRLRKAIPRGADHLLLVLDGADGERVAGQWYADPARAARVARETSASTRWQVRVRVLPGSGVLLQPHGADRRMPALHRLAAATGASLVAHRPERRAMVRRCEADGVVSYTKVVRPEQLPVVAARAAVRIPEVAVPTVTAVDAAAGTVTSVALAGRTLQQLLDDASVPDDAVHDVGLRVGRAVARLHGVRPVPGAGPHDAAAEAGVTRRWIDRAAMYGLLNPDEPQLRDRLTALSRLLAEPPCDPTYVHRDLHDLQVLVTDRGDVGMLDFDLASIGEPALDLANLLVHLEFHARHRAVARDRFIGCAFAVVDGYQPSAEVWRRVPAYALATRLRLLAVNAFRPPRSATARALLSEPPLGPLRRLGQT